VSPFAAIAQAKNIIPKTAKKGVITAFDRSLTAFYRTLLAPI
jgi:hypothetical protein